MAEPNELRDLGWWSGHGIGFHATFIDGVGDGMGAVGGLHGGEATR